MFKATLLAVPVALLAFATSVQADLSRTIGKATRLEPDNSIMPPAKHAAQWWTHPLGCEYSRAGRPGETVWFLIINTARPGCPTHIVQHSPYGDVY